MQGRSWAGPKTRTLLLMIVSACLVAPLAARAEDTKFPSGVIQAGGPVVPDGEGKIQQVGCATCGSGLLGPGPMGASCGPNGCGDGCGGPCYPGRYPCDCCGLSGSKHLQALYGIYQCICCPDPCYEPRWIALANNAFFIDAARPVTQTRLGADLARKYQHPDRAELFWPQVNGRGPRPNARPALVPDVDYQDGYLYMEGAVDNFSFFINLPYRHSDPRDPLFQDFSGFGDMSIGTKSLLLDCELIQFTFQFVTYIPTGTPNKGLSTGHTALEPGLLTSLKLTPESYLQSQLSYRFPLGGTEALDGSLLHVGLAYNRLLWNCGCDIQLIGTLEANYYCVPDGRYTVSLPAGNGAAVLAAGDADILNVGPGVRLVVCNKIDFGIAYARAVTGERFATDLLRCEFRWRF